MSKLAEALVWERSRCGKSDLLMLVKIADLADDDGRNAWPEVPALMRYCRAKERTVQYTLQRLVRLGEIEIEYNDERRPVNLKGGRKFLPKWYLHVRCVYDWSAYKDEFNQPATLAGLRTGRPTRKPATLAGFEIDETRNKRQVNPQPIAAKPAKSRHAYKERSVSDPVVEQVQGEEQGLAPLNLHGLTDDDAEKNVSVLTKLAHETFELMGDRADLGELADGVKSRAARLHIRYNADVVRKAIDAALWQRQHRAVS